MKGRSIMQAPTLLSPTTIVVNRYHVDLSTREVRFAPVRSEDLEDALGGIARATKLLVEVDVDDPYAPSSPLVMNLGLLSGTRVMTGLRTFFHGYSPLKVSDSGAPGLMWSSGSGHFGTKLRGLGIDEVIFVGRAEHPTLLHLTPGEDGEPAVFEFLDASDLSGASVNERIQGLHGRYPQAHFAVIGPAGERYESVRYASIALSTDNQLESGDAKPRFCGRGGYGGVMGSKNLWAIAADGADPGRVRGLRDINREINLGPGSARYRDLEDDRGGTWRTMKWMHEERALPEFNFAPTSTDAAAGLYRPSVEEGPYEVKAEGCYLCGIRCHKNVYDEGPEGETGRFRAKVDYEPITLLSSNLGIYDPDQVLILIDLADEMGMDSVSLGVTLGYVMDYNRRNNGTLVDGLSFGDFDGVANAIRAAADGRLPEIGMGVKRIAGRTGESGYAMHSKGVEYPAYQPHINPGFPWALAGGHMTMRTFMLYVTERQTGLDYWVDAITESGPLYLMDDITGLCKFANASPDLEAEALRIATGLDITSDDLTRVALRTQLRGYANERRRGFGVDDYRLPAEAHGPMGSTRFDVFNTPEFFSELRERVMEKMDQQATAAGFPTA
ncbi:MAG: aldehyde ferredoxin oxidoreductase C-terminal domain-containing protein [Actinomycetota bacterium]|nr:aldehyde ferredoxin oxidoreductase C-terminal domain-containing protein [Actinomycetota bacterium]